MRLASILIVVASLFLSCQGQTGHSVTVRWQAGGNYGPSIEYRVWRGATCDTAAAIATLPRTTFEYTDTNVSEGQTLCYMVSTLDTVSQKESKSKSVTVLVP